MTKKLNGKIALVTGASRGLGAEIAKLYAAEGAHVILLARSVDTLTAVYDEITANGGTATIMPFDLTNIDMLEALGPTIFERFGGLDIWVANAGIIRDLTPISHSKMKDWQDIFTTNVFANVQMIRTLEPLLKASNAGRAIIVGSSRGVDATPYFGAYSASKAAVMHLGRIWAEETKNTNLQIHIVDPGKVDTDMLRQAFPGGYKGANLKPPTEAAKIFLNLL